ncbi:3'(2'),5'-bisphosphate nucleotidase [Carex littledalei]|uniref:3'(2'),5'-bisphosphate nucleotidase n=1 Tax=Carex littledalei TaxID=544730 RepID=A0A833REW1_9POAL|nr:3'(2'),5'-bisphosphate nucleotidase [Carex littledalei]
MAARLGLSTVFSLGPRKALPVRLPCLLPAPGYPFHRHFFTSLYSPISPLQLVRNLSQVTMSASIYGTSQISSYEKELAAAKKAASLAARLCQLVQAEILQSDVQSKADKSPVTVADYGSQAIVSLVLEMELSSGPFSLVAEEDSEDLRKDSSKEILSRITDLVNYTLSTDPVFCNITLSEEGVLSAIDKGKSEGGSSGRHWVLDPIDGTKGFVRGDQYAIALALLDQGKVVLGVLGCPNLPLASIQNTNQNVEQIGCLFSAIVGKGALVQSLDEGSSPTKIQVTTIDNPVDASFFESFEAAHSLHDLTSNIAKKLGVKAPPVRIDSQAKYGALARGDGAIYLRFPHKGYREKIWDHAAGYIVVTEAGGVVTDAAGNDLDFSKGRYLDLDTGIIATNTNLMPSLLVAVQESIKEQQESVSLL